jgi:hypothetical protein
MHKIRADLSQAILLKGLVIAFTCSQRLMAVLQI